MSLIEEIGQERPPAPGLPPPAICQRRTAL